MVIMKFLYPVNEENIVDSFFLLFWVNVSQKNSYKMTQLNLLLYCNVIFVSVFEMRYSKC